MFDNMFFRDNLVKIHYWSCLWSELLQLTPHVTAIYSEPLTRQLSILIYVFILARLIYKKVLLKKNKGIARGSGT